MSGRRTLQYQFHDFPRLSNKRRRISLRAVWLARLWGMLGMGIFTVSSTSVLLYLHGFLGPSAEEHVNDLFSNQNNNDNSTPFIQ